MITRLSSDSAQAYTTWISGQLVFHAAPMSDVLTTLSRWYGYQFRLADSTLARQSVTAVLDAQSSTNALGTIKLLLNVDYTVDGDVVTLRARPIRRVRAPDWRVGQDVLANPHVEAGR
jgi:ferric-dicitrate binding protein FerR (iron transport regulator)